jgi:hypothetical protein
MLPPHPSAFGISLLPEAQKKLCREKGDPNSEINTHLVASPKGNIRFRTGMSFTLC